jgi:hypothetical protein
VEEKIVTFDIAVCLPSIHPETWQDVYDSCASSIRGRYTWELVGIGPKEGRTTGNFRFISDFNHPLACLQRVLIESDATWLTWASDDGNFVPGAMDRPFESDAIGCMFTEGGADPNDPIWRSGPPYTEVLPHMRGPVACNPRLLTDPAWRIPFHPCNRTPFVSDTWHSLGLGIFKRQLLLDYGGWDIANFETIGVGCLDLAIRLQRGGVNLVYWPHCVQCFGYHLPDDHDHDPIKHAYEQNEGPSYERIYRNPDCVNRIKIPLQRPDPNGKWARRFK